MLAGLVATEEVSLLPPLTFLDRHLSSAWQCPMPSPTGGATTSRYRWRLNLWPRKCQQLPPPTPQFPCQCPEDAQTFTEQPRAQSLCSSHFRAVQGGRTLSEVSSQPSPSISLRLFCAAAGQGFPLLPVCSGVTSACPLSGVCSHCLFLGSLHFFI